MKRSNFLSGIVLGLLIMGNLYAQQREVITVWPGQVPDATGPKAPHVLSDNKSRNVTRIATVTNPVLHVYRPSDQVADKRTGIIVCPGGGYNILAVDLEGHEVAAWLAGLGYTAFVLEYRVPQQRDAALEDLKESFRLVRSRASEFNISGQRVGAIGFSAGGSLVARAGAVSSFSLLIYPAYLDQGEQKSVSPELQVSGIFPSAFIFCTADDVHGNSGLVMAGALRDAKVPVELHFYAEGGHGYGLRNGNRAAEVWPELAANWLQRL